MEWLTFGLYSTILNLLMIASRIAGSSDVAWVIVASNEDSSWSKRYCGPFNFSFKWVVVCPDLKVVSKHVMFLLDVLNKYCLFALVTIPPFVGHLYVSVWVAFSAVSGLA